MSTFKEFSLYTSGFVVSLVALLCILNLSEVTQAQSLEEHNTKQGPFICHGLLPPEHSHNFKQYYPPLFCPPNWAIYSTDCSYLGPPLTPLDDLYIKPQCCRLPFDDILLDEHIEVKRKCPENFVATGVGIRDLSDIPKIRSMRCTKINSEKYQLGKVNSALFWGYSMGYWKNRKRIMKRDIPAALRYGVGRWGFAGYHHSGCIGYPFGSLFVALKGKQCYDHIYRELQFKKKTKNSPQGSPVKMFPDCVDISDPFSLSPECIEE